MGGKHSSISEFKHHLNETGLVEEKLASGWVLWHDSSQQLQRKIISILKYAASENLDSYYMAQFWAVVKVDEGQNRHYLSASDQPFYIPSLRKRICWYRKKCMDYTYVVDVASHRVIGNIERESTPDSTPSSDEQLPLRCEAARCGFRTDLSLLLDSSHECYGMLEILYKLREMEPNLDFTAFDTGLQLKAPEDKMDSLLLGRDKYHYDGDDNDEDEYGGQVQDQIIDYLNSLKGPTRRGKFDKLGEEIWPKIPRSYDSLPETLKMLSNYTLRDLAPLGSILIAPDKEVFGNTWEIHLLFRDITPFFYWRGGDYVSKDGIALYMWHLYKQMKEENTLERFKFMEPWQVSDEEDNNIDRAKYAFTLAKALIVASHDQLVLVPYNIGSRRFCRAHWILMVIEPYQNVVSLLDPVISTECKYDEYSKHVVEMAMNIFNANLKNYTIGQPTWEVIKVPSKPTTEYSGYYVMRFMKEIVQGPSTTEFSSLNSLFGNEEYSQSDIDEVCVEWTYCIMNAACTRYGFSRS